MMSISQKFHQLARTFYFLQKDMEDSYCKFQHDFETKLFALLNLVVVIILLGSSPAIFLEGSSLKEILYRSCTLALSIIGLIIRNKFPRLQKLLLIVVFVTWGQYSISHHLEILEENSPALIYELGSVVGMMEMMLIMSAKNLKFRFAISIVIILGKLVSLHNVIPTHWRIVLMLVISLILSLLFCLIYDALDRKAFSFIYGSREKLKKFQYLLSNDLPSSVVVLTRDLNSVLYSNQFFKDNFKISGTLQDIQMTSRELFSKFMIEERDAKYGIQSASLFDYLQELAKTYSKELKDKEVVTLFANYRDSNSKSPQHYEVKLREILWDDETSYAMVMNNVSDKQTVIALKMADEQKDKVIATVSHELRTPINGILGLLEMAMARITDETSLNFLKNCKSCSKLLLYLVNSILDLSQLRNKSLRINKEFFPLKEFLEELESLYLFQSRAKGVKFMIEVDPAVPKEICTDRLRLLEILINLLGNAMKFTFKGEIRMKISLQDGLTKKLLFYIEDTGIGIKEENKSQLFTMFGKVKQIDKSINMHGAGLGLTISNELVKVLNEGDESEHIEFKSEFEKGSAFWFTIIISSQFDAFSLSIVQSEEASEVPEASEVVVSSKQIKEYSSKALSSPTKRIGDYSTWRFLNNNHSPGRRYDVQELLANSPSASLLNLDHFSQRVCSSEKEREVLIVDDNPFNILAASFVMENLGFKSSKAFNGKEALEAIEHAQSVNKKFDLILTDIQMPILDGLGFSKIITEKKATGEMYEVPIIAITANPLDDKERRKYNEHGIVHSLEKPLKRETVKVILDELYPQKVSYSNERHFNFKNALTT